MPNVTSSGTYTKANAGFEFLAASTEPRLIIVTGTTIGTTCKIQYKDDTGTFQDVANGDIDAVPQDKYVRITGELQLVFTGSPNCNVSGEFMRNV